MGVASVQYYAAGTYTSVTGAGWCIHVTHVDPSSISGYIDLYIDLDNNKLWVFGPFATKYVSLQNI